MGTGDAIVGILIIGIFFIIIGSRVYNHEKEHLDPLIDKVKGWFHKEEDSGSGGGSTQVEDYELDFRGKLR